MIELFTKVGNRVFPIEDTGFMQFPGGEWHMKAEEGTFTGKEIAWVSGADVNDYIKLAMWADVVISQGGDPHAIIPYLPAAQADRGIPFGASIYSELIAITKSLKSITYIDPHSNVMPRILRYELPGVVLREIQSHELIEEGGFDVDFDGIIAPDKGAATRAQQWADKLEIPLIQAGKTRDFESGQLTGFTCEALPFDSEYNNYLIVDDVCVGGGTFVGLVDHIKANNINSRANFYLYTTHGVYSQGTAQLKSRFTEIWTTNSLESYVHADTFCDIKEKLLESI